MEDSPPAEPTGVMTPIAIPTVDVNAHNNRTGSYMETQQLRFRPHTADKPGDNYEQLIGELPRIGEAIASLPDHLHDAVFDRLVESLPDNASSHQSQRYERMITQLPRISEAITSLPGTRLQQRALQRLLHAVSLTDNDLADTERGVSADED